MMGVIGNGSWATALVKMLTDNGHEVNWWMRNEDAVRHLSAKSHNLHYLPAVYFERDLIHPTASLTTLIEQSNTILIGVPSSYIVDILEQLSPEDLKGKKIISAIKGILPQTNQLLNEYLAEKFDFPVENYFPITGPCHAEEVAQERLSYITFSGTDFNATQAVAAMFASSYIKVNVNQDLWGSQYAAVLKNVYALGAGVAHGLGYGDNFLSVYITNCYREMYEFLSEVSLSTCREGVNPDFHTSAYLGDLLVTAYSPHSRNRRFGVLIGEGYSVQAASTELKMVAEGYRAVKGMHQILETQNSISLPILEVIYEMLWFPNSNVSTQFQKIEQLIS